MLTPERALLSLVNNILNYVRIEAGQLRYASERVPLHTLVTDLEALVSPQLGAKKLHLRFGECEKAGRMVVMRVRDSGVGIPLDKLDAIFEPFVQLDRNLTNVTEGSGLGLSMSRDLARAMGGDLSAESTLGSGSTFTLSLPRAD